MLCYISTFVIETLCSHLSFKCNVTFSHSLLILLSITFKVLCYISPFVIDIIASIYVLKCYVTFPHLLLISLLKFTFKV